MKQTFKHLFLALITATVLFSFTFLPASGIKGAVTPAESAEVAIAISGTDSLKTEITQGAFQFPEVKPGTYKVIVVAKAPFKDFVKEGVEVKEGETVDLGNIALGQ